MLVDILDVTPDWPKLPVPQLGLFFRVDSYVSFGETSADDFPSLYFSEYRLGRVTPKGYWLNQYDRPFKYQGNNWKKKYAYADPAEALEAFKYRLRYRRRYADLELRRVQALEALVRTNGSAADAK